MRSGWWCSIESQNQSPRVNAGAIPTTSSCVHADEPGSFRPMTEINNTGWKSRRERAADAWQEQHGGQPPRRAPVHDLRHTFGRRLRAAGVS